MLTILAIGKKHESWIEPGLERYQKRLKRPYNVKWILLPHSSLDGTSARQKESEQLAAQLRDDDFVVLLDEVGNQWTSPQLADYCEQWFSSGKRVACVIGGAYGVTEVLQQRADVVWSLSKLVFPHQLVRLLLVEQLYRAQEIARGGQYHHL